MMTMILTATQTTTRLTTWQQSPMPAIMMTTSHMKQTTKQTIKTRTNSKKRTKTNLEQEIQELEEIGQDDEEENKLP
jgi:hypothetical protein